jgi:hypothetical protein
VFFSKNCSSWSAPFGRGRPVIGSSPTHRTASRTCFPPSCRTANYVYCTNSRRSQRGANLVNLPPPHERHALSVHPFSSLATALLSQSLVLHFQGLSRVNDSHDRPRRLNKRETFSIAHMRRGRGRSPQSLSGTSLPGAFLAFLNLFAPGPYLHQRNELTSESGVKHPFCPAHHLSAFADAYCARDDDRDGRTNE